MTTARRVHYSYEQYLRTLEMSDVKLEYLDGEIDAMAGDTPMHARLAATVTRLLGNALHASCAVYSSDLKVQVEATGLSTFPDVTVVCGELGRAAIDAHSATNPTLLLEVTSKSTEDYDRREKLSHYEQCPSLCAVLFVSHRRQQVTVIERSGATFNQREFRAGEEVVVSEPALRFDVNELYAGVTLED